MPPPESQIPQGTMRIETELPVWPTEKSRQNGVHLHYWRMLSSSIPIEDLAKLPGNTKTLGLISRKLLIIRIDGGNMGTSIRDDLPTYVAFDRQSADLSIIIA